MSWLPPHSPREPKRLTDHRLPIYDGPPSIESDLDSPKRKAEKEAERKAEEKREERSRKRDLKAYLSWLAGFSKKR